MSFRALDLTYRCRIAYSVDGRGSGRSEEFAMTYKGHVKDGVVVLVEPADLKDGDRVSVRPLRRRGKSTKKPKRPLTLYERLKPVIGMAKGLPHDLAENHDHYLYGRPKVKR